jgi:putative membrane protein
MDFEILAGHLLKIVHIAFVIAGVGGALAQLFVLRRFRSGTPVEQEASEKMALAITKYLEFYGLLFALITGIILGVFTKAFGTGGWLHAKSALVVVLVGLAHIDLRQLKRMLALRAAGKVAEAKQVKSSHLLFGGFNMLLTLLIVALVVMKPF